MKFTGTGSITKRIAAANEPRAVAAWVRQNRARAIAMGADEARERKGRDRRKRPPRGNNSLRVDWAFSLGSSLTSSALTAGMYPAVFIADPSGVLVNCANDFAVYLAATSSVANPANVVGLNNLYSAPDGSGFCAGQFAPSVLFAYQTASPNTTSPVLSLDGKKIAWVENSATPRFHVLAWNNEGTMRADGSGAGGPIDISESSIRKVTHAPTGGSGTFTSLNLNTNQVTLSSVFVDYAKDLAYVGNNNGQIFRIKNVFCTLDPACANVSETTRPQPSLDTGIGGAWPANPLTVSSSRLSAPIVDVGNPGPTQQLFVSSADGNVYSVLASSGGFLQVLTVGQAGTDLDPPVVDTSNDKLYVFVGCTATSLVAGGVSTVVQANTDFTGVVPITIGDSTISDTCPTANVHFGLPDDEFFAANGLGGHILACGSDQVASATTPPRLYRIPVDGSGTIQNTGVTSQLVGPSDNSTCSPLTQFKNGATDRLFFGVGLNGSSGFAMGMNTDFTSQISRTVPNATQAVSGVVVDNTSANGSGIYFAALQDGNLGGGSCWAGTVSDAIINSAVRPDTSAVVTVSTTVNHGLSVGEGITISNTGDASLNGNWVVATTPSATQFTYVSASTLVASVAIGRIDLGTCAFRLTQAGLN